MRINESVMCANLGDPRSRDRELTQKTLKNGDFRLKIYYFAYNSKTTWRVELKFVHNVGAYKWFMQIKFGGARSRDENVTGRKWVECGQIRTDIAISVNTDFDGK